MKPYVLYLSVEGMSMCSCTAVLSEYCEVCVYMCVLETHLRRIKN